MGVTYLPFTISSDAGYADLPLLLLGAPVDIGALVKLGSRSLAKQVMSQFLSVCVSLFYVIDTGSIGSRARPGG